MSYNTLTSVPGIKVGHAQDMKNLTGCTVVLLENGARAGVDVRGGAAGTRETDLMHPMNVVEKVDAIMLSGGSAFGLDAASGAMQYLKDNDKGYITEYAKVPIVGSAVIYDLGVGSADVWPDKEMGFKACVDASRNPVTEGSVGAGCAASVAKMLGQNFAVKGGVGSVALQIGETKDKEPLWVGALVVVNALGNIYDGTSLVAGPYDRDKGAFIENITIESDCASNTTIAVVATNVSLSKEGANKVAQMAHDGLARAIDPIHTMFDGDTIFALSTSDDNHLDNMVVPQEITTVGMIAAKLLQQAVIRAVTEAESLGGVPSLKDIEKARK